MFTRRGYSEDGFYRGETPGTTFDITTPTWRLGEAILESLYIADALGAREANLLLQSRWTGLAGRRLVSHGNRNRWISGSHTIVQNSYEATETIALSSLPAALPELVYRVLGPLYQLFDFFDLPKRLVEVELGALQKNQF